MRKSITLMLTSILLASCSTQEENTSQQGNDVKEEDTIDEANVVKEKETQDDQSEQSTETVPTPDIEQIMSNYKESFMTLVESRDKKGRLSNFSSKDELLSHLSTAMSEELADWYVETYFREENGEII